MDIQWNTLTQEQKTALEAIINAINLEKSQLFLIEGPAGSGKTYMLKYLQQNFYTLSMSYTSMAARSFENGRTLHSFLQDGPIIESIAMVKFVTIDTANMMENDLLQDLDKNLQELTRKKSKFGGKIIVLASDFNQIKSIGYANWQNYCVKLNLTGNMRAIADPTFFALLQTVVQRPIQNNKQLKIAYPGLFTLDKNKIMNIYEENRQKDVAVLFATNEECYIFNNEMVKNLGNYERINVTNVDQREMLIDLDTICIFIGNKPIKNTFLNGTRFRIVNIEEEVIFGELLNGPNRGRIEKIYPNDFGTYPFDISFGMTIDKICGAEFDKIGIFLDLEKLFYDKATQAMFYTALSRVRRLDDVLIYDLADQ